NYAYRQVDHPYAPTIIVQDRGAVVSRIVVHGSNGSRTVTINASGTVSIEPYIPGSQSGPYRPRPDQYPSDGSSILIGPPLAGSTGTPPAGTPQNPSPSGGTQNGTASSLSTYANRVANEIEVFRSEFATSVGLLLQPNAPPDFLGTRRPTPNERQMVDTLGFMIESARQIANNTNNLEARRTYAIRLRDDYQVANTLWNRIQLPPALNNRWRVLQQSIPSLINNAYRG